jgi:methionine-gamma-lyase
MDGGTSIVSRHKKNAHQKGFHTRAVQTYHDGKKENRPLSTPIQRATTFQAESSESHGILFRDRTDRLYTRFGNPTLSAAEEKIALLEKAESALVFGSGMGAITTLLLTLLKSGDHVVSQREIFAQTFTFLDRLARSLGIETTFVDSTRTEEIVEAIRPSTKLVYIETPSNPLLQVVDIQATADLAAESGAMLIVDSTFASPYLQNPLALGATLTLHSGTKFLGGHSDVMCGVVVGGDELIRRIRETQILLGTILDPHAAWLLLRGIKTLGARVQRQCDNAIRVARFLASQKGIKAVHYPWLEESPYFNLAKKQMGGGGGVLSFEVTGELEGARNFLSALDLIPVATSLGGVETVIEIPVELDFCSQELGGSAEETGINPGLIRLSVGIEDIDDLIGDLKRGIRAL